MAEDADTDTDGFTDINTANKGDNSNTKDVRSRSYRLYDDRSLADYACSLNPLVKVNKIMVSRNLK